LFAEVVAGALRHFDGVRYKLYAWCVMPNHVHVVFLPFEGFSLSDIVHSWKSFSAQRINSSWGRRGTLWQREYYDHLIRNGEQFSRAVRYVAENPERARLKEWKWVEVCSRD
jgi:REP element-mobilizing transposase RayT